MQPYILCIVASTLAAASLVMAWTLTELPVLVFNFILKPLGYKKGSKFWDDIKPSITTRDEFIDAISWKSEDRPHYLVADLLSCQYCLSFHAAFWFTLIFSFIFSVSPITALLGALVEPIIINILIRHAK